MDIFGMSGLWIAAVGFAILAFILIAIAVTTVVINRHRPTVAEAVAAEERLARRQEELRDIDSKIHEAKARLTEADKKASEVALLEERVSNLKAEIETLEPRRAEILEVQTELERLTSELGDQLREVEKAKAEKDGLQRQIEHGQHLKAEMETLEKRVAELRGELEDLQNNRDDAEQARRELKTLGRELEELQEKKGELENAVNAAETRKADAEERLFAVRNEVDGAGARLNEIEAKISEAEQARERLDSLCEQLRRELVDLQNNRNEAEQARRELDTLREELGELQEKKGRLEGAMSDSEARQADAEERLRAARNEVELAEAKLNGIETEIFDAQQIKVQLHSLREEIQSQEDRRAKLHAQIVELERNAEELGNEASGQGPDKFKDLTAEPATIKWLLNDEYKPARRNDGSESAYLERAARAIKEAGLHYSDRTLCAFHTALKVAPEAPMTVLSGISGTGKTQLPRRYAQGMGIGFLPMPVHPRWDSPQDLMGFYNFIEKRYKATELARAMWHMDGHGKGSDAEILRDRMLLVLLDEMNLSRVEYYFAEFLSRLELRPRPSESGDPSKRQSAEILIEVPGEEPKAISLGHNVLFAGTMNEDESTQALSDKVLDRGNMLRFPAPKKVQEIDSVESPQNVAPPLSRSTWEGWRQQTSTLPNLDKAKGLVDVFSERMKSLGRPFGHRVGQAMLAYAANYPAHDGQREGTLSDAMADQVEMRLLPKLRGIELEYTENKLLQLADDVREKLRDDALGEAIKESVLVSGASTGRFVWGGLAR